MKPSTNPWKVKRPLNLEAAPVSRKVIPIQTTKPKKPMGIPIFPQRTQKTIPSMARIAPPTKNVGFQNSNQKFVNWGAVRQVSATEFQARTPEGNVLPVMFPSQEIAVAFLKAQYEQKYGPTQFADISNQTAVQPKTAIRPPPHEVKTPTKQKHFEKPPGVGGKQNSTYLPSSQTPNERTKPNGRFARPEPSPYKIPENPPTPIAHERFKRPESAGINTFRREQRAPGMPSTRFQRQNQESHEQKVPYAFNKEKEQRDQTQQRFSRMENPQRNPTYRFSRANETPSTTAPQRYNSDGQSPASQRFSRDEQTGPTNAPSQRFSSTNNGQSTPLPINSRRFSRPDDKRRSPLQTSQRAPHGSPRPACDVPLRFQRPKEDVYPKQLKSYTASHQKESKPMQAPRSDTFADSNSPLQRKKSSNDMHYALTCSIQVRSEFQKGFEKWTPESRCDHEYPSLPPIQTVEQAFQAMDRFVLVFQDGSVYTTAVLSDPIEDIMIAGTLYKKSTYLHTHKKFLFVLQKVLNKQLSLILQRAKFVRMAGEKPFYMFKDQAEGQEFKFKRDVIINFDGVTPHVKVRSLNEIHVEMAPGQKSFKTESIYSQLKRGRKIHQFIGVKCMVRTSSDILIVTVHRVTRSLSNQHVIGGCEETVAMRAMKRGCKFVEPDALVVETSHGLFSNDELHPDAKLNKNLLAIRSKAFGRNKYHVQQSDYYDMIHRFHKELFQIVAENYFGFDIQETLICAPTHCVPEIMVAHTSGHGESISSRAHGSAWEEILQYEPPNLSIQNLVVLVDDRFGDSQRIGQMFHDLSTLKPWIPRPNIVKCNFWDLCKLWSTHCKSSITLITDGEFEYQAMRDYLRVNTGMILRNSVKVEEGYELFFGYNDIRDCKQIIEKGAMTIFGKEIRAKYCLSLTGEKEKEYWNPIVQSIEEADAILILVPGKEDSGKAISMQNQFAMMLNGQDGINSCPVEYMMANHIRFFHEDSTCSNTIKEHLEFGLFPQCGASMFTVQHKETDYDLVMSLDVSPMEHGHHLATLVATKNLFNGTLQGFHSTVTVLDPPSGAFDNLIPSKSMLKMLQALNLKGSKVLFYRHNARESYMDLHRIETDVLMEFMGYSSNVTVVEVKPQSSMQILDVPYDPIKTKQQSEGEYLVLDKVTRVSEKCVDFYVVHTAQSNPVHYSIVFATDVSMMTNDEEVVSLAHLTHAMTKSYVKKETNFPSVVQYCIDTSVSYQSMIKTVINTKKRSARGFDFPTFHKNSLHPKLVS